MKNPVMKVHKDIVAGYMSESRAVANYQQKSSCRRRNITKNGITEKFESNQKILGIKKNKR